MARGTTPDSPASRRATAAASKALSVCLFNMAIQDFVCLAFHSYVLLRVWAAPDGGDAEVARRFALALLTTTVCTILLTRGEVLRAGRFRALFYRIGLFTPIVASYFEMRFVLPSLQPVLVDLRLLQIDEAIFGITPALWLERFNTTPIIEWFAFFYYSYFSILTAMLLPSLFFGRGKTVLQIMAGAMTVACVGHTVYTLVPGVGPYATLDFAGPIQGGFWWHQVQVAVQGAGAGMDIFPSLHTAYPSFFAIHAFSNRSQAPYRYVWPVLAFFAANIIVATLLLRWHYFIDVVFGFGLALLARQVSLLVQRHEIDRDAAGFRQPTWEPLFGFQDRRRLRQGE